MAEEIQVDAKISCYNGNFEFPKQGVKINIDQAVVGGGYPGTVSVNTTGVAVSLTGMTSPGWVLMVNLDETNFVKVGASGTWVIMMKPGEPALFRILDTMTSLALVADTADCEVLIQVFED